MKNWTVKEAVAVINAGTDTEAIKEIVKHFPLFAVIAARKDFDALAAAMPENLTVRKVENELNSGVTETTEADDIEETVEEAGTEESEGGEYENMSKSDLIALCEKRKIKVQKYQKPKQYYIDALNAAKAQDGEVEADEEDETEEDPVALYKQCKKAGLDVKPKKSAKYYKDALAKAAQEDEAEDEDWEDEDEEEAEEKPKKGKKTAKKEEKKPVKKAAKKVVEEEVEDEEDDDDDWDI